jgi:ABC-type sugar transport system ATPase subunit
MIDEPTLRVRDVHRAFSGIAALSGVDLDVVAGEVRALVGGNGSGKSTLIKIISGVLAPDRGVVEVAGVPHRFRGAADAHRAGVAAVHQELGVVPTLSVAENVFLGHRLPRRGVRVDWRTLRESAHELLSELGGPVDVTVPAGDLTPVQRTTVVIARALARDVRVLLLDEPTAALTETESAQVFQVVRRLRARGVGVLYTTHRLAEVSSLCDQVTVLRDGRVVGVGPAASYREDDLITAMVGEDVGAVFPPRRIRPRDVVLDVRGLTGRRVRDVAFSVHQGEVLGVAGLAGSGRSELLRLLGGAQRRTSGAVTLAGAPVAVRSVKEALAEGVAIVPEDRGRHGVVMNATATKNLTLSSLRDVGRVGFVSRRRERAMAADLGERLRLRRHHLDLTARQLSGGSKQKLVLGKVLARSPRVLLLDEPTLGVDVAARAEIYGLLRRLADDGTAVVLVSSDLHELLGLSDRLLVLRDGHVTAELAAEDTTGDRVLRCCYGRSDG